MGFNKWKAILDTILSLMGRKNQAKFENRIKITQPNSMILVSFSSAADALFTDVKVWQF